MNARQSFYSSVFEQINDYKNRKHGKHDDYGFLTDHLLELGVFSVILVVGIFGGYVFNVGGYFKPSDQAMAPKYIKVTQGSASDVFKAEDTSAAQDDAPSTAGNVVFIKASDDGYASKDNPERSYGYEPILRVDSNPEKVSYIKFALPKDRAYGKVELRLYPKDSSDNGGTLYVAMDNLWSERLLTYDSQPNAEPTMVANIGKVSVNSAVDIDVTDKIPTEDTVTFVIKTSSEDGIDYASKETGDTGPQLLLSE